MAAFLRGLLLFLVGAIVGAGGILFYTPSFNVVVSRNPGARPVIELTSAPATLAPVQVTAAPVTVPAVTVPAVTVAPAVVNPVPPVAVAAVAVEPSLDFKALSEHLILWPNAVRVKVATMVPVLVDGKKTPDLSLAVGTVLQVSKVLVDGSLEVRANGVKFEIKSVLTDFSDELAKRVAELVLKGTKFDSPYPTTPMVSSSDTVAPASVVATAPAVVLPKGPLTLAQRVDVLFGVKPEVTAFPAPIGIVSPAATVEPTQVAPVVTTPEQKAVEKGKDLDRKINQLFK